MRIFLTLFAKFLSRIFLIFLIELADDVFSVFDAFKSKTVDDKSTSKIFDDFAIV